MYDVGEIDLAEIDADRNTFEAGRRILFNADTITGEGSPEVDRDVLEYLGDLWNAIDAEIGYAPRYAEFIDVFEYELRQASNSMEDSGLVNDNPDMASRAEIERYDACNMTMFPYTCVDLTYSPSFDRLELGIFRSILADLQQMARIGNWITT